MLPMLPLLIAAIGGIGIFVALNWDDVKNWLLDIIPKAKEVFQQFYSSISNVTTIFVQKIKSTVLNIIHRIYFKQDNSWYTQDRIREVPESEVPAWVKEQVSAKEVDKTRMFERELDLELN